MTTSGTSTTATDATKHALEAVDAFAQAMVAGDANALEGLLTSDFTYTHMSARVEPVSELIPSVRGGRRNRQMGFEGLATRAYPGVVLVTGLNHMVTGGEPPLTFDSRFTAVVVDVEGTWRLVSYHSTRVPEA